MQKFHIFKAPFSLLYHREGPTDKILYVIYCYRICWYDHTARHLVLDGGCADRLPEPSGPEAAGERTHPAGGSDQGSDLANVFPLDLD